jgi:hypothetical protein
LTVKLPQLLFLDEILVVIAGSCSLRLGLLERTVGRKGLSGFAAGELTGKLVNLMQKEMLHLPALLLTDLLQLANLAIERGFVLPP